MTKIKLNKPTLRPSGETYDGFALPQILILSIGLALGITGLLAASLNRLSTSKIASLEMQSKNAVDSGIFNIRSLLNNSVRGALYYYWLTKSCSATADSKECYSPPITAHPKVFPGIPQKAAFPDFSQLHWTDTGNTWCDGISAPQCYGRQVGPMCTYGGRHAAGAVPWASMRGVLSGLLDSTEDQVAPNFANKFPGSTRQFNQTFLIKSLDYVGGEDGGESSISIEGFAKPIGSSQVSSSSKLRANIAVTKVVTSSGFAVLSAGSNERDGNISNGQSLYLGDLNVTGDKTGSIIWRRNIKSINDCKTFATSLGFERNKLPDNNSGKGGLWVQPVGMPSLPKISNSNSSSTAVFCTPTNYQSTSSKCNVLSQSFKTSGNKDRTMNFDDIFVYGKNTTFDITTSDKSRVTMIVKGSIHIANDARFCHRDNSVSAKCGSGKPQNLTILFEKGAGHNIIPNNTANNDKQELACSSNFRDNGDLHLVSNTKIPHNSLIIGNTSTAKDEKFGAFIYAPQTTLSTISEVAPVYQKPSTTGSKHIVAARGVYAFVENTMGASHDKAPRLIRSPNGKLIPFSFAKSSKAWDPSFKDLSIIAIGTKLAGSNPGQSSHNDMILVYNKLTKQYSLRGINIINGNTSNGNISVAGQVLSTGFPGAYIDLLGSPLTLAPNGNPWISYYGIELDQPNDSKSFLSFKSIAWMKNICIAKQGKSSNFEWEFNEDYNKDLAQRYQNLDFNYGVPYYRGQAIKVWDILRDFNR